MPKTLILLSLALAGCASAGGPNRNASEYDALAASCRERGGVLTPIPGAVSGRPAADFACEIRGGASRLDGR